MRMPTHDKISCFEHDCRIEISKLNNKYGISRAWQFYYATHNYHSL